MKKQFVPDITDERVAEMLKTITPLVRKSNSYVKENVYYTDLVKPLHRITLPTNLRGTAFTWDPEFLDEVDESTLVRIKLVGTYHTTGYHGVCKPSIVEVLAQIPEYMVDAVAAFEVCMDDEITEFVDRDGFYGHRFVTIFYAKRPEKQ